MRSLLKSITIFIIISISGCSNPFNPSLKEHNDYRDSIYSPDSPENVLRNLMLAYNQKDIDLYKSCLDKEFRFHVVSQQAPEIGQDWWGYEQEIEFHNNLFSKGSSDGRHSAPNNIFLNLEIPPASLWQKDNQVGHENWIIISCPFYLQLSYSGRTDIVANGFAKFHLKPSQGKWHIAIWVDESNI